jgi:hypothetical protein
LFFREGQIIGSEDLRMYYTPEAVIEMIKYGIINVLSTPSEKK